MENLYKTLGPGSLLVILVTLVLFIVALFVKGFTHDLLLETAIFLVSVKLILLSYRNSQGVEAIQQKLDVILAEEKHLERLLAASRDGKPLPEKEQGPKDPVAGAQ